MIVAIFLIVVFLIKQFAKRNNCEESMLNGKLFSCLGNRANFRNNIKPTITDGVLVFTLALIFLIYIGGFSQMFNRIGGIILTEVGLLLIAVLYAIYIKANLKDTFSLRLPKIRHVLGVIPIWMGTYYIMAIAIQIILVLFPENKEVLDAINESTDMGSTGLNLLIVAVLPAICEEVLFRGFILSSFKGNSKKSRVFAVVATGVLFGIMHLNFIRIIPISILGIAISYCVIKSNSIFVSMFMHFINNSFAIMVVYLSKNYLNIEQSSVELTMPSVSDILITLGIGILLISLGRLCYRKPKKQKIILEKRKTDD